MMQYICPKRMTDTGFYLAHQLRDDGTSINAIAKRLRISWRVVRDHLQHTKPPSVRRKTPQPPKMSAARRAGIVNRRKLVKFYHGKKVESRRKHTNIKGPKARPVVVKRREYPSCASIARKLAFDHNIPVSSMTIRRGLWNLGAIARRRPKFARLRDGDHEQRLLFCKSLKSGKLDVGDILFTDEKYFDCNDHGCQWEWVLKDETVEPLGRDKWAPKVHVWGLIGLGVKKIIVLPERAVNGEVYRDNCLKKALKLFKGKILMQDGARAHVSGTVQDYLTEHKVRVLENWPARSPDLNPIENFWAILARRVSDCGPLDEQELCKFIKKVWEEYPQSEVDKLVMSFKRRVSQCILNKGKRVKLQ